MARPAKARKKRPLLQGLLQEPTLRNMAPEDRKAVAAWLSELTPEKRLFARNLLRAKQGPGPGSGKPNVPIVGGRRKRPPLQEAGLEQRQDVKRGGRRVIDRVTEKDQEFGPRPGETTRDWLTRTVFALRYSFCSEIGEPRHPRQRYSYAVPNDRLFAYHMLVQFLHDDTISWTRWPKRRRWMAFRLLALELGILQHTRHWQAFEPPPGDRQDTMRAIARDYGLTMRSLRRIARSLPQTLPAYVTEALGPHPEYLERHLASMPVADAGTVEIFDPERPY